uniref:Anoctamin n=1 Tax=Ascaris suum TaxID=6253 RepID=F1LEB9_ASCSU
MRLWYLWISIGTSSTLAYVDQTSTKILQRCRISLFYDFNEDFPLAPLLALVIGLIDIRIDARRLVWFNRRPVAFIATNIGVWNAIVNFIQYFAVITNAFIVAFTSNFCNESIFSSKEGDCSTQTRLLIALIFQNTVFASKFHSLLVSFQRCHLVSD